MQVPVPPKDSVACGILYVKSILAAFHIDALYSTPGNRVLLAVEAVYSSPLTALDTDSAKYVMLLLFRPAMEIRPSAVM